MQRHGTGACACVCRSFPAMLLRTLSLGRVVPSASACLACLHARTFALDRSGRVLSCWLLSAAVSQQLMQQLMQQHCNIAVPWPLQFLLLLSSYTGLHELGCSPSAPSAAPSSSTHTDPLLLDCCTATATEPAREQKAVPGASLELPLFGLTDIIAPVECGRLAVVQVESREECLFAAAVALRVRVLTVRAENGRS